MWASGPLRRSRGTAGAVRADLEFRDVRDAADPVHVQQHRGGVVGVVGLADAPAGVDAVDEQVPTILKPGQGQMLPFQDRGVGTAVADRDALANAQETGLAEAAARPVAL